MAKYQFLEKIAPDLLKYYNSLNILQKRYVDLRVNGISKSESYKQAGYKTSNPMQAACVLEKRCPNLKVLIDSIKDHDKMAKYELGDNSIFNEIMNSPESKELNILRTATADEVGRIRFYRDIINGNTKVKVITKTKNDNNELVISKVEIKEPTIQDRINARKELDRILGLKETGNAENKVMGDNNSQTVFNFNVLDTSSTQHQKQDFSIKDNDIMEATVLEKGDEE